MHEHLLVALGLYAHGLHHTAAGRLPVARIHVDVFAPETLRTMIGKASAAHFGTAFFTHKVLNIFYKFFRHFLKAS